MMRRIGLVFLAASGLALSAAAPAQVIWDMPNVVVKQPKFGTVDGKARPDVWPRLDKGAILCKTEADLERLAALRRGDSGDRPACSVIRAPTAIQIVRRAAPGRTQVTVTEQNGAEGWTDAWLPDRAPPIGGKGVTVR